MRKARQRAFIVHVTLLALAPLLSAAAEEQPQGPSAAAMSAAASVLAPTPQPAAPSPGEGAGAESPLNRATGPREAPAGEIAAVVTSAAAHAAAADAAVNAVGKQSSAEDAHKAAALLDEYCQSILALARLKAPTDDKRAHCRAAIQLADRLKAKSGEAALPTVRSLASVRELDALLGTPREQVQLRFARAAELFREGSYRQAADQLSSYLEVSETACECSGLLLHGLCRAYLSYTADAMADWQKVRELSKDDRLVRKAIYWTALVKIKMGQKEEVRGDLQLLVERYTPSEESGQAATLLRQLFAIGKGR